MFGRRRSEAEVEAIYAALAADADARAELVQALARIDKRLAQGLDEQAKIQTTSGITVQHLRATVLDTRSDLALAVTHLAQICTQLSERIDAERVERQAFIDALTELAQPSGAPEIQPARPGERVLGGSFPAVAPETIDVRAETEQRQRWA